MMAQFLRGAVNHMTVSKKKLPKDQPPANDAEYGGVLMKHLQRCLEQCTLQNPQLFNI